MKNISSFIVAALTAAVLSGCATPARIDQMVSSATPEQRIKQTPFRSNVAVKEVTGGKETNPMWISNVGNSEFEQALEASLRDAGLLAAGKQAGKYLMIAHLEKLDQPMMGIDMTVTATVSYTVYERSSGKEILNRRISIPFTAQFSSAFMGTERLRIANEGAIRTNIAKIVDELFMLKLDSVAVN